MDVPEALLALQDVDLQIMRLEKQLDELPEKRAILTSRARIAEIRKLYARTEAVRKAQEVEVKRLEDDTAALTSKMESEQAKMTSGEVTNPKELQAIALEMDSLRRRRTQLDDLELERLGKVEAAAEQSAKVVAAMEAEESREAELIAEFKDKGSHLLGAIEELKTQRETLKGSVPAELMKRYEALRDAKHGIAVGLLDGEACGVCQVTIPTGKLETLRGGPPVGECPNCSRMLVIRDEQ